MLDRFYLLKNLMAECETSLLYWLLVFMKLFSEPIEMTHLTQIFQVSNRKYIYKYIQTSHILNNIIFFNILQLNIRFLVNI